MSVESFENSKIIVLMAISLYYRSTFVFLTLVLLVCVTEILPMKSCVTCSM